MKETKNAGASKACIKADRVVVMVNTGSWPSDEKQGLQRKIGHDHRILKKRCGFPVAKHVVEKEG